MKKSIVRFRVAAGPLYDEDGRRRVVARRALRPRAARYRRSGFRVRLDLSFVFRRSPR